MMNTKAFIPEEVEQGLHLDLIKHLLDYNSKSKEYYYDIHITTDGYCTIVEWVDRDHEGNFNEGFKHVGEDQRVMTECKLPDNSIIMCYDEEDVNETLEEWLNEHPKWKKDFYGIWYEEDEE